MYQDLHFYIDLDWEKHLDEDNYLKQVSILVEFALNHKSMIFYSKPQLLDFTKNCLDLDENFTSSIGNQLDLILRNAKPIPIQEHSHVFELCYAAENTILKHIDNHLVSTVNLYPKQAVLLSSININPLLKVHRDGTFEKVIVSYLNKLEDIQKWIAQNSTERNFKVSPKHGENGIGNWKGESKLLCSYYEAFELLKDAIGNFIEQDKRLFNWDNNHHTYIEFFWGNSNPQNEWHGFHLDQKDWNRVPASIRKFFNN